MEKVHKISITLNSWLSTKARIAVGPSKNSILSNQCQNVCQNQNWLLSLPKGVMVGVIRGLKLQVHQVDSAKGRTKEENLHRSVIQRNEVGEQVQVTRREYNCEKDL